MKDNRVETAVYKAKKLLFVQNRDSGHDLEHHQEVWQNCKLIIEKENLVVNEDLLKVATFWHDVVFVKEFGLQNEYEEMITAISAQRVNYKK